MSANTTFLVCHGAWGAGWSWKKMHPLMQAAGHRLLTPSYTGLGERAHLASPSIDLEAHIADILNVIKYEDLRNIVLLGHSYGGMVATGVADRTRDRVRQLIYLDAFVPRNGQSLFDLNEPGRQPMRDRAKSGDGWRVPPNPTPPDTPQADLDWLTERRVDMPIKCFEQGLKLSAEPAMPRSYHLRHPHHARRYVWAVCRARQKRSGMGFSRDRRQPFAERHRAGSVDGGVAEDCCGLVCHVALRFTAAGMIGRSPASCARLQRPRPATSPAGLAAAATTRELRDSTHSPAGFRGKRTARQMRGFQKPTRATRGRGCIRTSSTKMPPKVWRTPTNCGVSPLKKVSRPADRSRYGFKSSWDRDRTSPGRREHKLWRQQRISFHGSRQKRRANRIRPAGRRVECVQAHHGL